ncbi:putative methyltransferase-like protein 24 [Aplochiton taeniatus]
MWTDMGRDCVSRAFLLRMCFFLTALCMCVHVYLERGRRGPLALLALGRPVQARLDGGAQTHNSPSEVRSSDPARTVKRRVSYVRTLKKDIIAGKDPSATCCPPHRPNRKVPRWHIDLEPWASESRSLENEARRFLDYITSPQVLCVCPATGDAVRIGEQKGAKEPWTVCLDPQYSLAHRIHSKNCRVYSLGLGVEERTLERSLARQGCEVHCFDPSLRQPHLQEDDMWLHRLSVDWRDPNPAIPAQRQHSHTKKMATILKDFGHRQVDVLKADVESAEWKILENLVLEGVLDSVAQLLLEVHLHWAGFEVGGDEPSVVRYWFSLLKELERAHFRLFHCYSDPAKPHLFLHKNVLNASSTYILGWVNTLWKQ